MFENAYLQQYEDSAIAALSASFPEVEESVMRTLVSDMMRAEVKDPKIVMANSYTGDDVPGTLLSTLDYIINDKPIIAGNGTLFVQHKELESRIGMMLKEILRNRSILKNKMFAVGDESDAKYKRFDIGQQNQKKLANSHYGGSGMPSSAFFNPHASPSTTATAQSVISTCETAFEAFLGSGMAFMDPNECYDWIVSILKEEKELPKWIHRKSADDVYMRLAPCILHRTEEDLDYFYGSLCELREEELTQLYWVNNIIEFTREHLNIIDMHNDIINSLIDLEPYTGEEDDFCEADVPLKYREEVFNARKPLEKWNDIIEKEKLYNPNDIPDSVKKKLDKLGDIYIEYCYYPTMCFDRIYRLRNFGRTVVTTIDTDSNFLSIDTWMNFWEEEVLKPNGREYWDNIFAGTNLIIYVATKMITLTLDTYGLHSNIDDENRKEFSMKNEFLVLYLTLSDVRKRYLSKVLLREGHRLKKPKYDVKGFDFKKASTSEAATDIFYKLAQKDILDVEDLDLVQFMNDINEFKNEVRQTLESGKTTYLPIGNCKELEAYDDPLRQEGARAVFVWNALYPEKAMELPTKLCLLKTTIESLDDIKEMQHTDYLMYMKIKQKIFDIDTSMLKRKGSDDEEELTGLRIIGIPMFEEIPKWVIPYIDYTSIINNVVGPLKSLTEAFNMPNIDEDKNDRKSSGASNMLRM